ncbi:F-box domain, Leucine-rich repeat domain, L domain-like protein [Artemisia annua]|uniref:F-box domain, Leucine-rich repeat domain, L domain-like protein n=1 Tax=Artemisia annua TaxID=35608 RepID=A0A2U1M6H5_ARTAN|nr:F-box domain, Leucine-rich repeat domain, L domain-like protein [Artemisia annua]
MKFKPQDLRLFNLDTKFKRSQTYNTKSSPIRKETTRSRTFSETFDQDRSDCYQRRSIKLGVLPYSSYKVTTDISKLTSSCLSCLNGNSGAPGLRRLHLYNIRGMDNTALSASLSVCPSLIDLEIVCSNTVGSFHFSRAALRIRAYLEESKWSKFVRNCPNITTLALKGFEMSDRMACKLVKELHKLKYVNFSTSFSFTGSFLKNLGTIGGGNNLEVMILRDARNLRKVKVKKFLAAIVAGEWRISRRPVVVKDTRSIKSFVKGAAVYPCL